jgi:hypothetical protein
VLEEIIGFEELSGKGEKPELFGRSIGKTEAEIWIYSASILAWLIPVIVVLA